MKTIKIGNRKIGLDEPVFIIAEAGVNHNGSLDLAYEHIRKAKQTGADAIKFQSYTANRLVTKTADKYWHIKSEGSTQYETFSKLDKLPADAYRKMVLYAKKIGIILFSTPFELEAVDLLEKVGVPAYKIASADITYHQLLRKVAKTKKPIILSTGASSIGDIEEAVQIIKDAGNEQIILLHCILSYPTKQEDANLLMIDSLSAIFPEMPIGFSDHTFSSLTPALAVMRGAKVIEKHFTIDKFLPDNPDHTLGVDPQQMQLLVKSVRLAEKSLGKSHKTIVPSEKEAFLQARRSIVANMAIKKGEIITKEMLICKRPGAGLAPKLMDVIIGRKAIRNISEDCLISWGDFA